MQSIQKQTLHTTSPGHKYHMEPQKSFHIRDLLLPNSQHSQNFAQLPRLLSIFMHSRYDFPLSLWEKKVLTNSSIPTLLNNGGFSGLMRLVAGPTCASNLGLTKKAMEILSFTELTVALCSTLRQTPLLIICKFKLITYNVIREIEQNLHHVDI